LTQLGMRARTPPEVEWWFRLAARRRTNGKTRSRNRPAVLVRDSVTEVGF